MIAILIAATVAMSISLVSTAFMVRYFRARGFGQLIRDDGPKAHLAKRGTPTMGGVAIIVAALGGYFGAYVIIAFWIFRHGTADFDGGDVLPDTYSGLYTFEAWLHSDALAIAAAAALGACLGFLWWNAPPAKIFMGDTGSLAIGGMLAALAVLTETELLLVILAGLFVVETASVIVQVFTYRLFGRRVFKMTPLHHHFELLGWQETTVIVRFWIIGGLAVFFGLGLFYAEYLGRRGGAV